MHDVQAQLVIDVRIKNVYGRERAYPVCEQAKLLARLTGRRSFTDDDLDLIRRLGYRINVLPNPYL